MSFSTKSAYDPIINFETSKEINFIKVFDLYARRIHQKIKLINLNSYFQIIMFKLLANVGTYTFSKSKEQF